MLTESLPWVEGVAHGLADEDEERQHQGDDEEAGEAEPRALEVFLALGDSSPSEGEPGGRPKPRKSSEVSVVIEPLRMKGRKVSVATMAFGSRWRNMMVTLPTPSARAAFTYSKFRAAQELGAHHADQRHPGEQEQDAEQHQKLGMSIEEMMSSR